MTGAAPRVRSGMDINAIKQKLSDLCAKRGGALRSRQVDALVEVLVEEITPLEARVAAVEVALARLAADHREEIRLTLEGMTLSAGALPVPAGAARLPDHES